MAFDQARAVVGLDVVRREADLPAWTGTHPHRPMWDSDRSKLRKFQIDKGIIRDPQAETEPAETLTGESAVKVYFKRGCPYARAAFELLREREIAFDEIDVKGDDSTLSWLKITTGSRTTPQVFVHGESIGGFDELRAIDGSGELAARLQPARKPQKVSLNVIGKQRSPFEDLLEVGGPLSDHVLEGDELIARVNEVLEECRPMLRADGGDVELLDVSADSVNVQLTGNCVGCPSSQATLRQGIERRLRARIPQIARLTSPQLTT